MLMHEKKNFFLYSFGRLVSMLGSGIQMIALPLFILDLTGSASMMGIFSFLSTVPMLFTAPFSGVIGDRLNRKNIMVNMDIARGMLILLMGIIAFYGTINLYLIFIMQVLISTMNSIFGSATAAMLGDIVAADNLAKANSKLSAINSLSMIIGPALGGILYGVFGITAVFFINGISFILSGISEIFIIYKPEHLTKKVKMNAKQFVIDVKEGILFIKDEKGLKYLMLFALTANFLIAPILSVTFPFILREEIQFSGTAYGIIQTAVTTGALLGSIIFAIVLKNWTGKKSIGIGLIGMNFSLLITTLLIFPRSINYFGGATISLLVLIFISMIFVGVFNIIINIPIQNNLQKMTPSNIRSRVFSVLELVFHAAIPVGSLIIGFFTDLVPSYIVMFSAIVLLVFVGLLFIAKSPLETFDPKIKKDNNENDLIKESV